MKKILAIILAVGGLTACSPTDFYTWQSKSGRTTTITTRASAGPDDGGGSWFRVSTVCDGEPFWRRGTDQQINGNSQDGYYYSSVQCFDNRVPVMITQERW